MIQFYTVRVLKDKVRFFSCTVRLMDLFKRKWIHFRLQDIGEHRFQKQTIKSLITNLISYLCSAEKKKRSGEFPGAQFREAWSAKWVQPEECEGIRNGRSYRSRISLCLAIRQKILFSPSLIMSAFLLLF